MESNVWFNLGVLALTVATGAAIAAVGLTHASIAEAILATVSGSALLMATGCFVAHWDVNRGRRIKRSLILEEDVDDFGD